MSDLYPLLMTPAFDPRPWGTHDLSPIYPNHKFEEKIGEAWLTGDQCKIQNGALAGQTLEHIRENLWAMLRVMPGASLYCSSFSSLTKNFLCRFIPTTNKRVAFRSRGAK